MKLVEKQLRGNTYAQIHRHLTYDYNGEAIPGKYAYSIDIEQKSGKIDNPVKIIRPDGTASIQNESGKAASIQRTGKFSRYGTYNDLPTAQRFFEYQYGTIEPGHLRGIVKANYLKNLSLQDDSVADVVSSVDTAIKVKGLVSALESEAKAESKLDKSAKPAKVKTDGIMARIRIAATECKTSGFTRSECAEYLSLEGFKQSTVTRVCNEIYGKVVSSKAAKSAKSVKTSIASVPGVVQSFSPSPVYMSREWYQKEYGVDYSPSTDTRFTPGKFKKGVDFTNSRNSYGHGNKYSVVVA